MNRLAKQFGVAVAQEVVIIRGCNSLANALRDFQSREGHRPPIHSLSPLQLTLGMLTTT